MKKWIPALGWGLCIAALATMLLGAVLQEGRGVDPEQTLAEHIGLMLGFASFPVLGALIASRSPRNPLGWIFVAVGLSIGILLVATEYAYVGVVRRDLPLTTFALWLEQWMWYPALGLIAPFTLLLFPDGKPPPGRFWRLVAWVSGLTLAIVVVGATFQDRFVVELDPPDQARLGLEKIAVRNPLGLGLDHVEQALGPVFAVFGICAILSMFSLVLRFWRSRGDERQQMKLLTMAAVVVVVMSTLGDLLELPGFIFPLVLWMIPGAVAVAIFKHRLYDVDVIINRTLVYGAITGVLVLVYLGSVFLLQSALTGITEDSDLAVAASTLAVAALFRPVRARIQAFIDRRFNRRKYNAQLTLESFSSHLRDEVDLQHLAHDLAAVVRDTMQPAYVSVWLRAPERMETS